MEDVANAVIKFGPTILTAEPVAQQAKYYNPEENIPVNGQGILHVTEEYEEKAKLTRATLTSKGLIGTIIPTLQIDDKTVARKATGDPLLQEETDRFKESLKGLTMSQMQLLQNSVVEIVDKYFNRDSFIKKSHPHRKGINCGAAALFYMEISIQNLATSSSDTVQNTLSEIEKGIPTQEKFHEMLDEWYLGQQRAIMANQKTGIKEADMKALFHAICVGASSMQDTNTALAFKFIQLGEEVRAAMASGIITNHEEMCTIFDRAYMETRGRTTATTAPPTGRPQVVYLAQEYERPQAPPHYHAQSSRGGGARGAGNGGGARGGGYHPGGRGGGRNPRHQPQDVRFQPYRKGRESGKVNFASHEGHGEEPIPSNVQRQLQMQSEAIASIREMMLGMVKEKAGKARQGAAYHAREDEEEEDEVIDHSFHGKRGFTRVSPKAYLTALEASISVGNRVQTEEGEPPGVRKEEHTTRKRSHEEFTAHLDRVRELAKALQGDLGEEREKQENIPQDKRSTETATPEGVKDGNTTPEGAKERTTTAGQSGVEEIPNDIPEAVESSSDEEGRMQKGLPLRRSTRTPTSKVNYATTKSKERTRSEPGPGSGKRPASTGKTKQPKDANKVDKPKGKTKGEDEVTHTAYMAANLYDEGNAIRAMENGDGHKQVGVEKDSAIPPPLRFRRVPMGLNMAPQEYLRRVSSVVRRQLGTRKPPGWYAAPKNRLPPRVDDMVNGEPGSAELDQSDTDGDDYPSASDGGSEDMA